MKTAMLALLVVLGALFVACHAQRETETEAEDDYDGSPCFPDSLQLIKRANEDCDAYAERVCKEAQATSSRKGCSLERCEEETKLRCPFREVQRGLSNYRIRNVAEKYNIWDANRAHDWCVRWFGNELANLTRIAAVWDALSLMPCYEDEDNARSSKCFVLETDGIAPTHPLAKWCYRSRPMDLNVGAELSVQCCYSEDLKLLTLGHKGAGSVDYVSAVGSDGSPLMAEHFEEDVLPYLACCALSDNCGKYGALRPATLRYESSLNVSNACEKMESVYKWAPYHKYPPPYHPMSALYEEWAALNLTSTSKIPSVKLSEVLQAASVVVEEVSQGRDPYAHPAMSSSTHEQSTAPKVATTTKTKAVTTTKEPLLDKVLEEVMKAALTQHEQHVATTTKPKPAAQHTASSDEAENQEEQGGNQHRAND